MGRGGPTLGEGRPYAATPGLDPGIAALDQQEHTHATVIPRGRTQSARETRGIMPLSKANVTIASRLMLPTHAIFSTYLGVTWAIQDPTRTHTKALTVLNVWPIEATGVILAAFGVALVAGLLSQRRTIAAIALAANVIVYLALAGIILAASISAHASWSAAAWPVYIAVAHFASMLSLANDEGPRTKVAS